MVFSFATALYVLASVFTLGVTLWALGSSALARDLGSGYRFLGFLSASLIPAAAVAYGLGGWLGVPYASWALAALPVLGILATLCNTLTISRQGVFTKLLHFPILVFNALLIGVYACRALQEIVGLDLGTPAAALTHAHAVVQTFVGHPSALTDPLWLHLPLVLPLAYSFHLGHTSMNAVCALFATGFTTLYLVTMPYAFERVSSYRAEPGELPAANAIRDVGVEVPWAEQTLTVAERDSWRQAIVELGVSHVAIAAGAELFADEVRLLQVRNEIAWSRERGLEVVACALPPRARLLRPAATVTELASDMAQLHWLLAERLAPDLLVLYAGPFEDLVPYTAGGGTLQQWVDAIRRSAADVARANADVRVAVTLGSRAPHAEELFRMLVAQDSPVHTVGLIFSPGPHNAADLTSDLDNAARWCQRIPGTRPIRILPARGGIHQCGGELGQWHFLLRILGGLEGTGRVSSATINGLIDHRGSSGLMTAEGRRRLAFRKLADRIGSRVPGTPR